MEKLYLPGTLIFIIIFSQCIPDKNSSGPDRTTLSDSELLAIIQQKTFQYFWDGAEKALAAKIDTLWRQAEWSWFRKNGENVLYWQENVNHSLINRQWVIMETIHVCT